MNHTPNTSKTSRDFGSNGFKLYLATGVREGSNDDELFADAQKKISCSRRSKSTQICNGLHCVNTSVNFKNTKSRRRACPSKEQLKRKKSAEKVLKSKISYDPRRKIPILGGNRFQNACLYAGSFFLFIQLTVRCLLIALCSK